MSVTQFPCSPEHCSGTELDTQEVQREIKHPLCHHVSETRQQGHYQSQSLKEQVHINIRGFNDVAFHKGLSGAVTTGLKGHSEQGIPQFTEGGVL